MGWGQLIGPRHLFWDTCVFLRYITRNPPDAVLDIEELILDTKKKAESERRKIYFSSVVYAEIRSSSLKERFGTIEDVFDSLGTSFEPIEPTVNIMKWASELRDAVPINPNTGEVSKRILGTADAIHLATCIFLRDVMGVSDVVFHTFDKGRGANWEGKCIPLIGFENWYPESSRTKIIGDACSLERVTPHHPEPKFGLGGAHGAA